MIGAIESAGKSKSGKTLSVKVNGQYFSSKNWELESMVGKEVVFEPSPQVFPDGTSIQWLNEYSVSGAAPAAGPAAQVMDQAVAQKIASAPDKDSLIGAMALTKACAAVDAPLTWANFLYFYDQLKGWNPNV